MSARLSRQCLVALVVVAAILLGNVSVDAHDVEGGPAAGGGGGNPFNLDCGADHVLIGIAGIAGSWIDRIEALCMKIVVTGHWDGPEVKRTARAGGQGGFLPQFFDMRCPEDHAVSGIDGHAASFVDRIRIFCKRITPRGGLTGDAIPQTPAGGDGGRPFYQLNCPADHPGRRLTGRAASYVDQIQLHCDQPVPEVFGAPMVVSPLGGEVGPAPVLFRWVAQDGAAFYRLCLEEDSKFTGCKTTGRIKVNSTQITVDLRSRTRRRWVWSVQGCNSLEQCGPDAVFSSFSVAPTTTPF